MLALGVVMRSLLIIGGQPTDIQIAADIARSLGFAAIEARTSSSAAKVYLEKALEGQTACPM